MHVVLTSSHKDYQKCSSVFNKYVFNHKKFYMIKSTTIMHEKFGKRFGSGLSVIAIIVKTSKFSTAKILC